MRTLISSTVRGWDPRGTATSECRMNHTKVVYFLVLVLVLVLVLPLKCRELEKNATTSRQPGATPPLPSFSQDTPDSCGCGSPLSLSLFEEV